jgi:hypothetical protein
MKDLHSPKLQEKFQSYSKFFVGNYLLPSLIRTRIRIQEGNSFEMCPALGLLVCRHTVRYIHKLHNTLLIKPKLVALCSN